MQILNFSASVALSRSRVRKPAGLYFGKFAP